MLVLGQQTLMGSAARPLATDASIEATKHTAAGDALLGPEFFPFGDLEFRGLLDDFPGLLDFFRPGLLDDFRPPFLSLDAERAGVGRA
eukprot:s311_g3.t1